MVEAGIEARAGLTERGPDRVVRQTAIEPPDRGICAKNEYLAVAGRKVAEARRGRREPFGQSSGRRGDGDGGRESADRFRRVATQQPIAGRGGFEVAFLESEVGIRAGEPVEDAERVDSGVDARKDVLHVRHEAVGVELEQRESRGDPGPREGDIEAPFLDQIGDCPVVGAQESRSLGERESRGAESAERQGRSDGGRQASVLAFAMEVGEAEAIALCARELVIRQGIEASASLLAEFVIQSG